MKSKTYFLRIIFLAVAVSSAGGGIAGTACDISQQMQQVQAAEKQRQIDGVSARFNDIMRVNDAERACLENFPAYPTQLPSTAVLIAAFNKIKQNACKTVSQNVTQVQNQVQSQLGQQTGINPAVMQQIQSQVQSGTQSAPGIVDKAKDVMKRLFQ